MGKDRNLDRSTAWRKLAGFTAMAAFSATSCNFTVDGKGGSDARRCAAGSSPKECSAPAAPLLASVTPTSGPISGGTALTIAGENFAVGATVQVGGVACTSAQLSSSREIVCTTGPHAEGAVELVVTSAEGRTAVLSGAYTYQAATAASGTATLTISDEPTLDFGTKDTGTSTDKTLTVTYAGSVPATSVAASGLSAPLAFKGGVYPGAGGTCGATVSATCTLVVTYAPTSAGSTGQTLTLAYNTGSATTLATRAIAGAAVVPNYAPTSVSISSDKSLQSSVSAASLALTLTGTGTSYSGGAGSTAAGGVLAGGTPLGGTGAGSAGTGSGAASGNSVASGHLDITSAFSATITVAASFPAGASPACGVLGTYSASSCTLPTFTLNQSGITNGTLQVKGYASNGSASDYLNSNTLITSRYTIRQVSNTTNNAAFGDNPTTSGTNFRPAVFNGKLYFVARTQTPGLYERVYEYNDSTQTLSFLTQTTNTTSTDAPYIFGELAGKMYFFSRDTLARLGLFSYDGAAVEKITSTASYDIAPGNITPYNGKIFFVAKNSNGFYKLFRWNGTTLDQITNTRNNQSADDFSTVSTARYLIVFNNKLYFNANNSTGYMKLMEYDDNSGNVNQISNLCATHDYPTVMTEYNGKLFFSARSSACYYKLFKFDGASITQITNTTGLSTVSDYPGRPVIHNNKLFFYSYVSGTDIKLFSYNDPTDTLTKVSNLVAGDDGVSPLLSYGGKLYFSGYHPSGGTKIHIYDDSTGLIRQVTNTTGNNATSDAVSGTTGLYVYNGRIYFLAKNSGGFYKLYMHDPSDGGVVQMMNVRGDAADDFNFSTAFVTLGSKLFFYAYNSSGWQKVYRLCDHSTGCTP